MFEMHEKALNEARDFHDWMLRQHEDQETIWFVNVLTALLRGLIMEYEQLNLRYQRSMRLMAWACRNLMEISIFTEYTLNSEANAHELIEDVLIDTLAPRENSRASWTGNPTTSTRTKFPQN